MRSKVMLMVGTSDILYKFLRISSTTCHSQYIEKMLIDHNPLPV